MTCVRLPDDMIVAIARVHETARPILTMIAACKSWRSAVIARAAELWRDVALRRFPRLAHIVCHAEKGKLIDWKMVYENQRKAEAAKPARCVPAQAADHLCEFVFTIELLDEDGSEMNSWTGTFEPAGTFTFLVKLSGCYSRVKERFDYFQAHAGEDWSIQNQLRMDQLPHWTLRCFLTGRLDMSSTVKLYEGIDVSGEIDDEHRANMFAQGPPGYPFMFANRPLPTKHVLNVLGVADPEEDVDEELHFRVHPSLFLYAPPDGAEAPHVLFEFYVCGMPRQDGAIEDRLLDHEDQLSTIIHALRSCLPHGAVTRGNIPCTHQPETREIWSEAIVLNS